MATQEEFLAHLWRTVINTNLDTSWFASVCAEAKALSSKPFSESEQALARLLRAGADPRDVALVLRMTAYEAVFATL